MGKSRSFLPILVPGATVFISSFCIMVLELVASRLIARHLGSSLYTWTAVIGVVLTGITIGNYLGGRIADRFQARKTLASLFAISSAACVVTVILNNLVGEWMWIWHFSWPVRTFTHVSLVFLLPSVLLGTISPVVAKMALDRGLPTGRTVGDIYACGAAGSIAGTFAAGYYLIAAMGTIAIIWTVGSALLLMAILYWARFWPLYLWAVIFVALMTMAMAPIERAKSTGSSLALREQPNTNANAEVKQNMSNIHYNIGTALQRLGKNEEASEYMRKAIEEYRKDLAEKPDSIKLITQLGNALAQIGRFSEATIYFQRAVDMNPYDMQNHLTLAKALEMQKRYDAAIAALKKAVEFMEYIEDKEAAAKLQEYLELVEFRKSKRQK